MTVVEFPVDEYDPENLAGGNYPPPGRYHFDVTAVIGDLVSSKGNPQIRLDCEVLAGTPAGQEGKFIKDYMSLTKEARSRCLQFAVAVGLVTKEELIQAKATGIAPKIDFDLAVGRQFCGEVVADEFQGRVTSKIQFGMWHVDDPEAKDIPKNAGKLAQLGTPATDPLVSTGEDFI